MKRAPVLAPISSELWLRAEQISRVEGISVRGVLARLDRALVCANGNRMLFERRVKGASGGGAGGGVREWNITELRRMFPSLLRGNYSQFTDPLVLIPEPAPSEAEPLAIVKAAPAALATAAPESAQPSLFEPPQRAGERVDLPEHKSTQARERWAVIQPLVVFTSLSEEQQRAGIELDGRRFTTATEIVAHLATKQFAITRKGETALRTVSEPSIWRWHSLHKDGRFQSLANKTRSDADESRIFKANPRAAAFIKHKLYEEKIGNRYKIYDALVREWPALAEDADSDPPCYATLNNFIALLPKPPKVLAHEGPRAYMAKCSPHILRTRVPVMDWWTCDHREKDVHVINTLFPSRPPYELMLLWMTSVYDMGSAYLLGWTFSPTPSSNTIGSAFCMAALNAGGIAPNFYWDNGEDFKKFERILLAPELESSLRAQTEVTCALPYRPRSKPIESSFNFWSQRFDPSFRPGWRGRTPGACPEDTRAAFKVHAQFLKELAEERHPSRCQTKTPFITDRDLIYAAREFAERYNNRPHRGLGGRTPRQVFEEGWPESTRRSIPRELLAVAFWQRVERTVNAGGTIDLHKTQYEPTPDCMRAMADLQGRRVTVKYDPFNLGVAIVTNQHGKLLGELRAQKFLQQSPHGRVSADDIAAAEKRRIELQRHHRGQIAASRGFAERLGWKSEAQLLIEGGRSRMALSDAAANVIEETAPAAHEGLQPAPAEPAALGPAFASDAVEKHAGVFDHIELEPAGTETDEGDGHVPSA